MVLQYFGFPNTIVQWIMECVTTDRFSICFNGKLVSLFRALGDPLSLYLFVMVMEVLSRLLRRTTDSPLYRFHLYYQKVQLSHLCFADDLLIFSSGTRSSVGCVRDTLSLFGA